MNDPVRPLYPDLTPLLANQSQSSGVNRVLGDADGDAGGHLSPNSEFRGGKGGRGQREWDTFEVADS